MIQCLKALENLHAKGICHRDIKVANSFLAEDGAIKIGDMNVSKRMNKGHLHILVLQNLTHEQFLQTHMETLHLRE